MWWSRGAAFILAALLLGACGFRPLYGTAGDGQVSDVMQNVEVIRIPDRIGQELHNELLDLLNPRGRPANPLHSLEVQLSETKQQLAIERTSFSTRANLIVRAVFYLRNPEDPERKPFHRGEATAIASYDVITEKFATIMAEKNARSRAVQALAQDIRLQLAAYYNRSQTRSARDTQ